MFWNLGFYMWPKYNYKRKISCWKCSHISPFSLFKYLLDYYRDSVHVTILPTTREGNVFTKVCLFTGGGRQTTPDRDPHGQRTPRPRPPPCMETPRQRPWDWIGSDIMHTWKEHGARQEVTSYMRPWYWHLVAATAAVGTHPTGMHSCCF